MRYVIRLSAAIGIVGGSLLLNGCSEEAPLVELPPASVVVEAVTSSQVGVRHEFIGRTEAIERIELRARVSGTLEERNFREGSAVETGDLLFRIEREPYQVEVDQAMAQLESDKAQLVDAEAKFQRMETLFKKQSVSEQDRDEAKAASLMAQAAVQGSEAALKRARLDLSYVEITAPTSGLISEAAVDAGNLVSADSGVLATIVRLDPIHVHFTVSDNEYLEYRSRNPDPSVSTDQSTGAQPSLRLSNNTVYPASGSVELINNEVNPGTGTISLRAAFPNPDNLLRPGQFVTVVFERTLEEPSILVPQSAVLTGQSGYSVLVVGEDNTVEQRKIETGDRSGDSWVVESGLESGERIIVRGLQKVRPGDVVNAIEEAG